ncbi:DNA recombination protein RmuC [Campylobacter pinnipediorum]|uniref:DNA recombination protein RmuC n=1 Tax=Campylobacter pinnipediorum TaxID=1965231 RepID=UPI00084D2ADD|nr:DNA recombination protein RmuC [Campylobacter pinnipediorum]
MNEYILIGLISGLGSIVLCLFFNLIKIKHLKKQYTSKIFELENTISTNNEIFKDKKEQLKNHILNLEEDVRTRQKEIEILKNVKNGFDEQNRQFSTEIMRLNSENAKILAIKSLDDEKIRDLNLKIGEFEIKNRDLIGKKTELETKLEFITKELDKIALENKKLDDLNRSFEIEKRDNINKIDAINMVVSSLENDKKNLIQTNNELNEKNNALSNEYDRLKITLNEQMNDVSNKVKAMYDRSNERDYKANRFAGEYFEKTIEQMLINGGMVKDITYFAQKVDGALRPDFKIVLPNNKFIIIDAKNNIENYNKMVAIITNPQSNEEKIKQAKSEFATTMKNTVLGFGKKGYNSGSGDIYPTLFMCVPYEIYSYLSYMQPDVLGFANEKNIEIVEPTHIRMIVNIAIDFWSVFNSIKTLGKTLRVIEDAKSRGILAEEAFNELVQKVDEYTEKLKSSVDKCNTKLFKSQGVYSTLNRIDIDKTEDVADLNDDEIVKYISAK